MSNQKAFLAILLLLLCATPAFSSTTVKVAPLKVQSSQGVEWQELRDLIEEVLEAEGPDLVVTPEFSLQYQYKTNPVKVVCSEGFCTVESTGTEKSGELANAIHEITALAEKYRANIVLGTVAELEPKENHEELSLDIIYNSQLIIDNRGRIIGKKRKTDTGTAWSSYELVDGEYVWAEGCSFINVKGHPEWEFESTDCAKKAYELALETVKAFTLTNKSGQEFTIFPIICGERDNEDMLEKARGANADMIVNSEWEGDRFYESITETVQAGEESKWWFMIEDPFVSQYVEEKNIAKENSYLVSAEGGSPQAGIISLMKKPIKSLSIEEKYLAGEIVLGETQGEPEEDSSTTECETGAEAMQKYGFDRVLLTWDAGEITETTCEEYFCDAVQFSVMLFKRLSNGDDSEAVFLLLEDNYSDTFEQDFDDYYGNQFFGSTKIRIADWTFANNPEQPGKYAVSIEGGQQPTISFELVQTLEEMDSENETKFSQNHLLKLPFDASLDSENRDYGTSSAGNRLWLNDFQDFSTENGEISSIGIVEGSSFAETSTGSALHIGMLPEQYEDAFALRFNDSTPVLLELEFEGEGDQRAYYTLGSIVGRPEPGGFFGERVFLFKWKNEEGKLSDYFAEQTWTGCSGWSDPLHSAVLAVTEKDGFDSPFSSVAFLPQGTSILWLCASGEMKVSMRYYDGTSLISEPSIQPLPGAYLGAGESFLLPSRYDSFSVQDFLMEVEKGNMCIGADEISFTLYWNESALFPEETETKEPEAEDDSSAVGQNLQKTAIGVLGTIGAASSPASIPLNLAFWNNAGGETEFGSCIGHIGCFGNLDFPCCNVSSGICMECTSDCGCKEGEYCSPFGNVCISGEMSFDLTSNLVVSATKISEDSYELATASGRKVDVSEEELKDAFDELDELTGFSLPLAISGVSEIQNESLTVCDMVVLVPEGELVAADAEGSFWRSSRLPGGMVAAGLALFADDVTVVGILDDPVAVALLAGAGVLAVASMTWTAMQGRTIYIEYPKTCPISRIASPTTETGTGTGTETEAGSSVVKVGNTYFVVTGSGVTPLKEPPPPGKEPDDDDDKTPLLKRMIDRLKTPVSVVSILGLITSLIYPGVAPWDQPSPYGEETPAGEEKEEVSLAPNCQVVGRVLGSGKATIECVFTGADGAILYREVRTVSESDLEAYGVEGAFFNATPGEAAQAARQHIGLDAGTAVQPREKPIQPELELDQLVAVRLTNQFPENGVVRTSGTRTEATEIGEMPLQLRETIHFSLNGPVTKHDDGDWTKTYILVIAIYDRKFAIIVPLADIMDEVINLQGEDTWVFGNLELPSSAVVLGDRESLQGKNPGNARTKITDTGEQLHEAAQNEIREQGYTVAEIGGLGWTSVESVNPNEARWNTPISVDGYDLLRVDSIYGDQERWWRFQFTALAERLGVENENHDETAFRTLEEQTRSVMLILFGESSDLPPQSQIDNLARTRIEIYGLVDPSIPSQREALQRIEEITDSLISQMEEKFGITLNPSLRTELDRISEEVSNMPQGETFLTPGYRILSESGNQITVKHTITDTQGNVLHTETREISKTDVYGDEEAGYPPLGLEGAFFAGSRGPIQTRLHEVFYGKPNFADGTMIQQYPWTHVTSMERLEGYLERGEIRSDSRGPRGVYFSYGDVEWDRWGLTSLSVETDTVALYFEPELNKNLFLTSVTGRPYSEGKTDYSNLLSHPQVRKRLGLPEIEVEWQTIETYRESDIVETERLSPANEESKRQLLRDAERYYQDLAFRYKVHDKSIQIGSIDFIRDARVNIWNPAVLEGVSNTDVSLDGIIGFGVRNKAQIGRLKTLLEEAGIETKGGRPIAEAIVVVDQHDGIPQSEKIIEGYYSANSPEAETLEAFWQASDEARRLAVKTSAIELTDQEIRETFFSQPIGLSVKGQLETIKETLRGKLGRYGEVRFEPERDEWVEAFEGIANFEPGSNEIVSPQFLIGINEQRNNYNQWLTNYFEKVLNPLRQRYGRQISGRDISLYELPLEDDPIWDEIAKIENELDELIADWEQFRAETAPDIENVLNTLP